MSALECKEDPWEALPPHFGPSRSGRSAIKDHPKDVPQINLVESHASHPQSLNMSLKVTASWDRA